MPRRVGALVMLVAFAAVAGWLLLRPSHREHRHAAAVAVNSATPVPSIIPSPASEATPPTSPPTPAPATPAPAESSTAAATSPPEVAPSGAPELALIVDDCGQWPQTERGFIALGVPLTLSVLPHVTYTAEIAREASGAGKGVMLHLPMETLSGLNPGPGKITTEMSDDQIAAQLLDDLAQVPLARGVNNHEGSKASADTRVMHDVIQILAQRGLFFIDSRTNAASVGEETARSLGVPTASRDVFLDNRADVAYSEGQLLEAAAIARRTGRAIAIGHPRPTTLAAVQNLLPKLQAMGIHFVLAQDLAGV